MPGRRSVVVFAMVALAAVTSGVLLAQPPQSVGTWASRGDIATPLSRGAAVTMTDGRTLIVGGVTAAGETTASVTVFDPVDGSSVDAGSLVSPRSGHTATLLRDGRVLVVGGRFDGGLLSSDIEIFDPATSSSAIVSLLPDPRYGHVAARLLDGTVLIAGGATTNGAVLRSALVFDPKTWSVTPVSGELQIGRLNAAATPLLDGRVLVTGGSDGTADLATAEIYEHYRQHFTIAATRMSVARQGHSAILLQNNGGVLVAGGTSQGASLASTDLFLPAVFPDPFSFGEGEFTTSGAMNAPRATPIAGGTSVEGFAFAAGDAADYEVYRFATVKTDTDDYAPGERAEITGFGWEPGEEVTLIFQEDPAVHDDYVLKVTADGSGSIYWNQWAPEGHDLGVRFYLTAVGQKSRAQVTFTDAADTVTTLSTSPNPSVPGQSVMATASVVAGSSPVTQGAVKFYYGGANCSGNPGTQFGPAGGVSLNASGQASASTTALTNGVTVRACYGGFGSGSSALQASVATVVQTVSSNVATVTTVTSSANPSSWGSSVAFTAVVARTSGSGTPTGSVQFVVDGTNVGAAVTLGAPSSSTSATAVSASITTLAVGTHTVQAVYVPTGTFVTSSGSLSGGQVVNKADAVCTVVGYTGSYDGGAHGATGSCVGLAGDTSAEGSSLDLGASFTNAPGGTANWVFTGGANYKNQSGSVAIVINKANATVSVNGYSGTYDGQAHGATGSATGVGGVNLTAALNLGASFTNVPGGTANWTFDGGINYHPQSGSVAITIAKANATVNVVGYTGVYDAQPHGATGTATGVLSEALAGLTLGAAYTDYPGGTAHWAFTDQTGNYNSASGDVAIVIKKANASLVVNGYDGTYDGHAHGATGSATGVGGVDLTSALNLGSSFIDAPGGTATWTFDGGSNYNTQTGSVAITIAKAEATINVVGYTGVYDAQPHGATGTATGVGGVSLDGLTLGSSYTNVPGGTAHWTFSGGVNYNDASGDVAITIDKAAATIVVTGYTGTYDGQAHGATGTATGVLNETLTGLTLGDTFTNHPGGTANWVFTGGSNYTNQSGSVAIVINKADATCTITGYTGTYDAAAHGASGSCAGVASDAAAVGSSLNLGASFTSAPGGTANWAFTGGSNYNDTSGSVAIVINKADAACTINGYTGTFDAASHGATGACTGVAADQSAAGSSLNLGDRFTNAPGGTANWAFTGGANYNDKSGSVAIVIDKADATCTIDGYSGTFDAAAHGATGSCTGVAADPSAIGSSLNLGARVTNAPGGTANWAFTGGSNYHDKSGSVAIVINKADAACTINGYTGIYDAAAHSASGSCVGVSADAAAAGSSLNLGASFTNVPGGTANWAFDGGINYNSTSGSVAITIAKAHATVNVVGYTGVYDAQPHGATGTATGVLNETLAGLTLGNTFTNHPGGTATWVFTDQTGNYNNAGGVVAIIINKANATIVVNGYTGTYDGQPHGATGSATGVGGVNLNAGLTLGASFVNVPGGTANWTFAGGVNYHDAAGTSPIVINKATANCTVSGYDVIFDGVIHMATGACTGVTGAALASLNLTPTAHKEAGDYTDSWTFTDPTGNYHSATGTVADKIRHWTTSGFYQPVDMSGAQLVWNTIKGGSTVPLKFNLFAGVEKKTSVGDVKRFDVGEIACATNSTEAAVEFTTTGGTQLRYDGTAGQFIQNWQTPKTASKCYLVRMTAQDGSTIDAYFKTK